MKFLYNLKKPWGFSNCYRFLNHLNRTKPYPGAEHQFRTLCWGIGIIPFLQPEPDRASCRSRITIKFYEIASITFAFKVFLIKAKIPESPQDSLRALRIHFLIFLSRRIPGHLFTLANQNRMLRIRISNCT